MQPTAGIANVANMSAKILFIIMVLFLQAILFSEPDRRRDDGPRMHVAAEPRAPAASFDRVFVSVARVLSARAPRIGLELAMATLVPCLRGEKDREIRAVWGLSDVACNPAPRARYLAASG